jgi:hypothetical protein
MHARSHYFNSLYWTSVQKKAYTSFCIRRSDRYARAILAGNFYAFRAKVRVSARVRRFIAVRIRCFKLEVLTLWSQRGMSAIANPSSFNMDSFLSQCMGRFRGDAVKRVWGLWACLWERRKTHARISAKIRASRALRIQVDCLSEWRENASRMRFLREILCVMAGKGSALILKRIVALWREEVVKARIRVRAGRKIVIRWSNLAVKRALDRWSEFSRYRAWLKNNHCVIARARDRRLAARYFSRYLRVCVRVRVCVCVCLCVYVCMCV